MANEKGMSAGLKATLELLFGVCLLLAEKRLTKNSKNSNIPPSADPNRGKSIKAQGERKPGGQPGHTGKRLEPVEKPDEIRIIKIERKSLSPGKWETRGYEKRQLFELQIRRRVIEYQAEIVVNEKGEQKVAPFPEGLTQAAQYGNGVKAHGVYMAVQQLIPCERASEHFDSQLHLPVSTGSICNFKQEASELLEGFEHWLTVQLQAEKVLNLDETGINIASKRVWLHSASSDLYTRYYPHEKRGKEAMDEMGILPVTDTIMIHDHWKAYYSYENKAHGLCNSHHIRELTAAREEGQHWAQPMIDFLVELNGKVDAEGGQLDIAGQQTAREKYRQIVKLAEAECPPPPPNPPGKRGRIAKSKTRNLIERLREYEEDTLRFMTDPDVPFTNNLAERDLRMTKVQQKISGCFRSWEGARAFCRIRSYLSTSAKHTVSAADALTILFDGKLPGFVGYVALKG